MAPVEDNKEEQPIPTEFKHLINGKVVAGAGSFGVINPSTGKVFAQAPHASKEQVDEAIAAAKNAFPTWRSLSITERKAAIGKIQKILKANAETISKLLTMEQGKPIAKAKGEVYGSFDSILTKAMNETLPVEVYKDTPKVRIEVRRVPIGVVACICPWNYPIWCTLQKWAPALVYGNTIIVKPSPFTPLTTMMIGELIKDCLPPGVMNVIAGDDKSYFNVGAYLSQHKDIAKVSFTGSGPTGKKIMSSCAKDVRRVTLEMGGNDPAIVREDVDIATTAQKVFNGAFENTGQICCAIKRCYVHQSIFPEFVDEVVKCANKAVVGDGFAKGVAYGPLCNEMQYRKVIELVEDARKNGAKIHCGGKPMAEREIVGGQGTGGYFYKPTIITGVKEGSRIVDEEQFGPVLPIMPYQNDEEAIERANSSHYGLGGSVWTKDIAMGNKLAERVLSGTVWVNDHLAVTAAPFGGFRESGIGREGGKADLSTFTELQTLQLAK